MYPRDEAFLKNVEIEVYENVIRLGYHASVVSFGGNNENEAAFGWFPETSNFSQFYTVDYAKLYFDIVYPALHAILPDRQWVHSSPSGGRLSEDPLVYRWGALTNNSYGDRHFYDYSNDCTDVTHFPRSRFVSEYGQQSWPSFAAVKPVTAEEDWGQESEWSVYRQRHPDGQSQLIQQMQRHFILTETTLGTSQQGFDNYLYLTQANQARCYAAAISYWRRIRYEAPGKTMGVLYWQLNDIWQGPSWSSIEYGGKWKILHYVVKKTYAPVLVSAQEYPYNNFSVYLTSDKLDVVKGKIQVDLYDWNGESRGTTTKDVSLPALGSDAFFVSSTDDLLGSANANNTFALLTFTDTDGNVVSTNEYYFGQFKDAKLQDPQLTATFKSSGKTDYFATAEVEVSSSAFAPFVFVESDVNGFFSDNGFFGQKGTRTLTFYAYGDFDVDKFKASLTVRSLFDTLKESA